MMRIKQTLKSHIELNVAWPFAAFMSLFLYFESPLFKNEYVSQFLISPWYIPTILAVTGFIVFLFNLFYINHFSKFKDKIPESQRKYWLFRVAVGSVSFIITETVPIFCFFIGLFVFANGEASPELEKWLIIDLIMGVGILPIYNYFYIRGLEKEFKI